MPIKGWRTDLGPVEQLPPAAREALRTHRRISPRLVAAIVAGLTLLAACGRSHDTHPTIDEARSELRGYIEDITQATASRYGVVDDRGHVMDAVKIIAIPESGGFVGLYHSFREDTGTFAVHLATGNALPPQTIGYFKKVNSTTFGVPTAPRNRSRETLFAIDRSPSLERPEARSEPNRTALFVLQNDDR